MRPSRKPTIQRRVTGRKDLGEEKRRVFGPLCGKEKRRRAAEKKHTKNVNNFPNLKGTGSWGLQEKAVKGGEDGIRTKNHECRKRDSSWAGLDRLGGTVDKRRSSISRIGGVANRKLLDAVKKEKPKDRHGVRTEGTPSSGG